MALLDTGHLGKGSICSSLFVLIPIYFSCKVQLLSINWKYDHQHVLVTLRTLPITE